MKYMLFRSSVFLSLIAFFPSCVWGLDSTANFLMDDNGRLLVLQIEGKGRRFTLSRGFPFIDKTRVLKVIDLHSGSEVKTYLPTVPGLMDNAYSLDGRHIVCNINASAESSAKGFTHELTVWDIKSGREEIFRGKGSSAGGWGPETSGVSADRKWILAKDHYKATLYSLQDDKQKSLKDGAEIFSARFSPTGSLYAYFRRNELVIGEPSTGEFQRIPLDPNGNRYSGISLSWSPSGQYISGILLSKTATGATGSGAIGLWDSKGNLVKIINPEVSVYPEWAPVWSLDENTISLVYLARYKENFEVHEIQVKSFSLSGTLLNQ
ncbi:MAG TPA: hypothetical protein DDY32_15250 [Desulfobulbaceae bacterium]|nr:hypothetical protein [Desulfobulbaceae bacterium]